MSLGSRLTTSKGRIHAFKLRAIRNKRAGRKVWYVGLTTSRYFWLDLNTPMLSRAVELANLLRLRLDTDVWVFQTNKSYHLITRKELERDKWRNEYEWWRQSFGNEDVCRAFIDCCLKYGKATIRVSNKKGNRPILICKLERGVDCCPSRRISCDDCYRMERCFEELDAEYSVEGDVTVTQG